MTELSDLKKKCYKKDGSKKKGATQKDFERLKFLQDAEPLSKEDLAEAQKREEERVTKDKAEYNAKQKAKQPGTITVAELAKNIKPMAISAPDNAQPKGVILDPEHEVSLEIPSEHPRIATLKKALLPFTKIECHDSRQNEYVLFRRGVAITAGDIRAARKAMKI